MDFKLIIFCLVLSLFMILCLNWIYFFDWDRLIDKLVGLIAPKKNFKEIEMNRKLRDHAAFKFHIKKWKIIFLINPLTFLVLFLTIIFITKKILFAFFCGVIVIFIEYVVLCTKENHERQKIIDVLHSKKL